MSPDRAHRLWRSAGLQVPRRRPQRRVAASRPRPLPPAGPNQVWAYDFVFDTCANGQRLKCLTVVDEWTREALAIDVASSIRSRRVVEVLSRLVSVRGAPRYLRSDNGPDFVSMAVLRWGGPGERRDRLHSARHALAGRNGRELQWHVPGRVSQRRVVPQPHRGGRDHRDLAPALQRGSPPLEPGYFDADRIQSEAHGHPQPDRRGCPLASTGPKNPGRSHPQPDRRGCPPASTGPKNPGRSGAINQRVARKL